MIAQFNKKLAAVFETVGALACGILAILVSITVFMRFVLGSPPHWAEELPRLLLVWSAFVGTVVCSYQRTQLSAGILPLLVHNYSYRDIIDRVNNLVLIGLFIILGKAGWDLTQMTMSQTTTALQIPVAVLYFSVVIGCAGLTSIHLEHFLEHKDIR